MEFKDRDSRIQINMNNKLSKSISDELSDVLFIPRKRPIVKYLILAIIFLGILGGIIVYVNGSVKLPFVPEQVTDIVEESNSKSDYLTVIPRTLCNQPGEEIYSDWFRIEGDEWTIKLTSERVDSSLLANTRLWYTTSDVSMLVEAVESTRSKNFISSYFEVGSGMPNGESENQKVVEQKAKGPGKFRLRMMCWNTRYSVELRDEH